MKVYFAGFDVFYLDAVKRFKRIKTYCAGAGLEAVIPFDIKKTESVDIFNSNMELLNLSDGVIANFNPFRGKEPDSGTVFEASYAYAKNKHIIGYTDIVKWESHILNCSNAVDLTNAAKKSRLIDKDGMLVEAHGNKLNLMLSESMPIINGDVFDAIDMYVKKYGV